jgi:hypothetical protein
MKEHRYWIYIVSSEVLDGDRTRRLRSPNPWSEPLAKFR